MYYTRPVLNIIEDGSEKTISGLNIPEIQLKYVQPAKGIPAFQVKNSYSAAEFLREVFPEGELRLQEHFFVLLMNRGNFVIGYYHQSKGGIAGTVVDVRLVFVAAIKACASSMILCHNHPSGNTKPSHEDIVLTKKIVEGGKYLDITVNDHIILTPDTYTSLGDEGLMGFTSAYVSDGSSLSKDREEYVFEISRYLRTGIKQNKKQVEKLAATFAIYDKTEVKELTELAIVRVAREFAHEETNNQQERFNEIVSLYENQVNLSHRTSQSILLQQYSTPAPIAYLAGIFCGIDKFSPEQLAFEPSAGNGLLTIAGSPENFVVNEIDATRYRNLTSQGFKELFQTDATQDFSQSIDPVFKKRFDAVITNPPFGKVAEPVSFDGYPIEALEHVMALRALETMKDNGKAAIIIGGHTPYDEKGRVRNGRDRIFFNYLYSHYNVVDVIPVDGKKLYSRQGTSFDTRLILISGRKINVSGAAPVFNSDRERVVRTFDELYERVMQAMDFERNNIVTEMDSTQSARVTQYKEVKPKYPDAVILVENGEVFETYYQDAIDVANIVGTVLSLINVNGENVQFTSVPADRIDVIMSKIVRSGKKVALMQALMKQKDNQSLNLEDEMKKLEKELLNDIDRIKSGEELGAPYMPSSESCTVLNTVVPDSMDYETRQALEFIKREVGGDIDEFVRQRLKYKSKLDLCKALSAEQTDAVAMAIYNIEAREQGMIIGDQTGIGKGRVAAAMIRYSVLQGHKPVFITEKPNLFSDIYRDLIAIGSGHFVPFIVNGRESKTDIKDENGEILYQALHAPEQKRVFESKSIPANADFVLATYSQFNSPDKKPEKPQFLLSIASGNIFILDESHNASGSSQVGEFLQGVLAQTKGVVFLSATFAKRPDNMPIYAMKTAIRDANMTRDDLIAAILKGGVALQEVLASQLVKEGQMLRRERSFEGVEVNYITLDELATEHMAIADNITEILREVIAFQSTHVDKLIQELDDIAVAEGKQVDMREGTSQAGVGNQPYFSKVFQVINQMLFSIKASAVADRAIERLKEGKKPVIAFASTMGSFIEGMENDKGLSVGDGDTINADFSEVLMRGLDGILRYTETLPDGKKEFKKFDVTSFSPEIRSEYLQIAEKIKRLSSGISISPIDIIIKKITDAGYKVAEVTGRKYEVQINTKTNKGIVMSRNRVNTNDAFPQVSHSSCNHKSEKGSVLYD